MSQQSYQQPYQPYTTPPAAPTSNLAIVSLVSGILGWTLLPTVGAIIAVITGHMAKSEIRRSNGVMGGNSAATWGLILGYVNIAFVILGMCLIFVLIALGVSIPILSNFNSY
jgi:hypothetical protein